MDSKAPPNYLRGWRKKFTESDEATAEKIRTTLLKQWLMPFLRVLRGEKGYFTLSYGVLTITTPDNRLVDIAHALSATFSLMPLDTGKNWLCYWESNQKKFTTSNSSSYQEHR
jgi:hypothetical protein